MPAPNFKRVDLDWLMPEFRDRLFEVIAACRARGANYVATMGYRSYVTQMNLWKQGRVLPGKVVTNAKGGESAHNFGLAVDFVADIDPKPGVQPGWAPKDYDILAEECAKAGLHHGRTYGDEPHVSWPGYVTGGECGPLNKLMTAPATVFARANPGQLDRLRLVWDYVRDTTPSLPRYP